MNKKYILLILFVGVLAVGGAVIARNYLKVGIQNIPTLPVRTAESKQPKPQLVSYTVETVAENLRVPWSMVFTLPQRILVSERTGAIRIIENGKLLDKPLRTFPEVAATGEAGLMGITLDPNYADNKLLYAAVAYQKQDRMVIKIVKFLDGVPETAEPTIILDDIPAASNHSGTRLKFGIDGKLYMTTGDAQQKESAQVSDSRAGKVLRMNRDGSSLEVFALGFRNSQGLDWDPETNELWVVDHGPSGFDGPRGGDEINLVRQGNNYGWPLVSHDRNQSGLEAPKLTFTPAIAPAALTFYRGSVFPQFTSSLFFSGLVGTGVYRAELSEDRLSISGWEKLKDIDVGRVRDIVEGPEGYLYFTTSNTDGRGTKRAGDDKIYRLVPVSP